MIARIRIEGEADSSERLHREFQFVRDTLAELFARWGVETMPAHEIIEHCNGDPDVSVQGNWKGRAVVHLDTQRLNEQIPSNAA